MQPEDQHPRYVVLRQDLDQLLPILRARGLDVMGPTIRDTAIVYEKIESLEELPAGWSEEQEAGRYRLNRRPDQALFGYAVGPRSWKHYLHPPAVRLVQIQRLDTGLQVTPNTEKAPRYAFLGVRSCDLHAIGIQDRVLLEDRYWDPDYRSRRTGIFRVAVNCGHPSATCFCASMGTGPRATGGFELALTEILEGEHRFVVETGTDAGREVLAQLPHRVAEPADLEAAERVTAGALSAMRRSLDPNGLKEQLYANAEHPHWQEVAERCLACTNCTMVCPTCFCTTREDTSTVSGDRAEQWRKWDSCFTLSFSYIHGGSVRPSVAARYRQWLMHKLAYWHDQFGTSGCVGCGRCITWCPVGIDITQEARALRERPQ